MRNGNKPHNKDHVKDQIQPEMTGHETYLFGKPLMNSIDNNQQDNHLGK